MLVYLKKSVRQMFDTFEFYSSKNLSYIRLKREKRRKNTEIIKKSKCFCPQQKTGPVFKRKQFPAIIIILKNIRKDLIEKTELLNII
jgi:hypothetical protein